MEFGDAIRLAVAEYLSRWVCEKHLANQDGSIAHFIPFHLPESTKFNDSQILWNRLKVVEDQDSLEKEIYGFERCPEVALVSTRRLRADYS